MSNRSSFADYTLSTGQKIEAKSRDGIALGDHIIDYSDDFTSFECTWCETSFEIPEIFQQSTDFNKRLYQLYIFGHFRSFECPEPRNTSDSVKVLDVQSGNTPVQYDPNRVHWQSENVMKVSTDDGDVITDGNVIYDSDNPEYTEGQMLMHGERMELLDNRKT